MGDLIYPLATVDLPPPHPDSIEGGVLICNKTDTLLPRKVGFGGNQTYYRRLYGTNLYLQPPPPSSWGQGID